MLVCDVSQTTTFGSTTVPSLYLKPLIRLNQFTFYQIKNGFFWLFCILNIHFFSYTMDIKLSGTTAIPLLAVIILCVGGTLYGKN